MFKCANADIGPQYRMFSLAKKTNSPQTVAQNRIDLCDILADEGEQLGVIHLRADWSWVMRSLTFAKLLGRPHLQLPRGGGPVPVF